PPHRLIQSLGTKKLFSIEDHRACPTNGSDFGSLRSQNLTLFVGKCAILGMTPENKFDGLVKTLKNGKL
ncbi:MAG: hypothetical protein PHI97_16230, partial [Desulfobulbus sp.]|nr:hypothetical protein [Desulfobulbus sp.]